MQLSGLIRALHEHDLRLFTTSDILTLTGSTPGATTHALVRLSRLGLVARIKRGIWINRLAPEVNPYEAIPFLSAPWPAYVSLYTALSDAGVLEEVPHIIYAVTPGRPRRYRTPIGEFRLHHLPERLTWGYEMRKEGGGSYPVAEPEKAFLDLVYLALVPRSPIQLPYSRSGTWNLDRKKLERYAKRFDSPAVRNWLRKN
ncbi:MAG: hypothetical protein V1495_06730 [Pseudomonadota bacterium]